MAISPSHRTPAHPVHFARALSLLLAGAFLLAGCKKPVVKDPNDPNFIVADKGNWTITRGQLNTEVDMLLKQKGATRDLVGPANMPYVDTGVLRNMVLKKLMLEKAAGLQLKDVDKDTTTELNAEIDQAKGTMSDKDFADKLKAAGVTQDDIKQRVHDGVVIHKVLEIEAFKNTEPSDQEINDIYNKYKDKFNIPAKLRARRVLILTSDKDTPADQAAKKKVINSARERVMKGEDFGKVATEVSKDRYSAPKGGDIGYFARGENEPGFDDVAFKTKLNAVSPVFQTQLGLQFLKIIDSQPAGVVSLADARMIIAPKLREAKQEQVAADYFKKVMADSGVNFHLKLVDVPAQMAAPTGPGGAPATGSVSPTMAPPPENTNADMTPPPVSPR